MWYNEILRHVRVTAFVLGDQSMLLILIMYMQLLSSMENACAIFFCHVWPVRLYSIFPKWNILLDRRYTTIWCNVFIMQLTTELHVSTL